MIDLEEWRDAPGFPGYEISSHGRVRRSAPGHRTFVGKVLKLQTHSFGYPHANLTRDGKHVGVEVHQLVALAFIGPRPTPSHQVAHADNDPGNCFYRNLRWATPTENNADKNRHGTALVGERNPAAKLLPTDVIKIRKLRAEGQTLHQIAAQFGIAFQTVWNIVRGQSWGHLNELVPTDRGEDAIPGS